MREYASTSEWKKWNHLTPRRKGTPGGTDTHGREGIDPPGDPTDPREPLLARREGGGREGGGRGEGKGGHGTEGCRGGGIEGEEGGRDRGWGQGGREGKGCHRWVPLRKSNWTLRCSRLVTVPRNDCPCRATYCAVSFIVSLHTTSTANGRERKGDEGGKEGGRGRAVSRTLDLSAGPGIFGCRGGGVGPTREIALYSGLKDVDHSR